MRSIALLTLLAFPVPAAAQEARARQLSAEPGATRTELLFPELGVRAVDARRVLPDGRVERLGTLEGGGAADVDALRQADHALELARHGKVDATLRARLAAAGPGDPVDVAFWLLEPDDGFDGARLIREAAVGLSPEHLPGAVRAARVQVLRDNEARLAPRVLAFAAAVEAAGGASLAQGAGWPLVIARVAAGRVPALAAHPLVDTAYVSQPAWAAEGDNAQGTMRTYNVHDQGVMADDSVRVLINDVGQVQVGNPYLPPITVLVGGGTDSHATGVAGNVANNHPQYYAAAFSLPTLYSAPGTGDFDAPNVWATGISAGIDVGNCSWWNFLMGKIEFLDRFFDYTIRTYSVMLFKSNGNQGFSGTPYATTPGNGYNMISTGNYGDANDVLWANDSMASSSSWWNPIEGHEKPELASPGDCVATTGTGGSGIQSCFGGTSSASPLTCGVGALLLSADNALLAQMTTLKAALMVSAWHNIEGAALISDKDGAGGTHAKAAHALVRDQQWWFQDVTAADFPADVLDVPMTLAAGDQTRVIALWFSNADASYSTDVLDMDLDLAVLAPGGGVVASSASAVNAFELASFVPAVSGTYTVRLTKQRFDGTSEPLTVAWSTRNDAGTGQIRLSPSGDPFAVGATPTLQLRDIYVPTSSPYAAWGSLSGASAAPLGGGFAAPVGFDPVSSLILALPGWTGAFGPPHTASADLPIPPVPGIAGLELYFALATWPAGGFGTSAPLSVSDPLVLAILP